MTIQGVLYNFFQRFISQEKLYSVEGIVSNVRETERLCDVTPIDNSAEVLDVRLQSVIGGADGVVNIPTDGSHVIVTFINKTTAYLSLFSSIDKVLIDTDLVEFNGGLNGGMVKVTPLMTAFNALQIDVNQLKTLMASWVPVPADGGASLKATTAAWYAAPLTVTTPASVTNSSIKQ